MPKRKHIDVFERWRMLDLSLMRGGQGIFPSARIFAKKFGVSERTIHNDIAMFRKLGQEIESKPWPEIRDYAWKYKKGTKPLFVANLREKYS